MNTQLKQPDSPTVSVVVPVVNEFAQLPDLLDDLKRLDFENVVIVDGGSTDGSQSWLKGKASELAITVLESDKGRAKQMNAGAQLCSSDFLLFLHADTQLPSRISQEFEFAKKRGFKWGRFDVSFSVSSKQEYSMRLIASFINLRSRLSGIATGDQAIFVDSVLFKQLGGFAELPIMEDVELSKRLKQSSRPYCSKQKIITSPRRWLKNGIIKTVLQMWYMRLAFFLNVPAETLVNKYKDVR